MIVYPINFNPSSDSGPNSFTKKLFSTINKKKEISFTGLQESADLEFCLIESNIEKIKPRITRLDGIYFNTAQDYNILNSNIRKNYFDSDCVIFQTFFNKRLIEKWFGEHPCSDVILNGSDRESISNIEKATFDNMFKDKKVWSCASSWRPHKRLSENLRYFISCADKDTVMLVAGKGATKDDFLGYEKYINDRIFYLGHLKWEALISLYKASEKFIHLSYIDHCPNVVVDAAESGCEIVCSSTGGTSEIEAYRKTVIIEDEWDLSPIDLYNPPEMNFSNFKKIKSDKVKTLEESALRYLKNMEKLIEKS